MEGTADIANRASFDRFRSLPRELAGERDEHPASGGQSAGVQREAVLDPGVLTRGTGVGWIPFLEAGVGWIVGAGRSTVRRTRETRVLE